MIRSALTGPLLQRKLQLLSFQEFATVLSNSATDSEFQAKAEEKREESPHGWMKTWQAYDYGGIEAVHLTTVRIPTLIHPSQVLIRVVAASVNPIDVAVLGGFGSETLNTLRLLGELEMGNLTCGKDELPITVGRDFAGEVVITGQNVRNVSVGDKVWGTVSPHLQGSHAEYVLTSADNVCSVPSGISLVEAASLPYVALTGWSAATLSGGLDSQNSDGARVLVLGASGGVGTFLTQLLAHWKAKVVGVCSEDAFELVMSLGAAEVYDYKDPVTKDILMSECSFDLILDASGSDDRDYMKSLKPWCGASYVSLTPPLLSDIDKFGVAGGVVKSVIDVAGKNVTVMSDGCIYKWAFFMPNPTALKAVERLVSRGKVRPVVDKIFPFQELVDAYHHVKEGNSRGKTVIDMSSQ